MTLLTLLKKFAQLLAFCCLVSLSSMGYAASTESISLSEVQVAQLINNYQLLKSKLIILEQKSQQREKHYASLKKDQVVRLELYKTMNEKLESQLKNVNDSLQIANESLQNEREEQHKKLNKAKSNTVLAVIGGLLLTTVAASI